MVGDGVAVPGIVHQNAREEHGAQVVSVQDVHGQCRGHCPPAGGVKGAVLEDKHMLSISTFNHSGTTSLFLWGLRGGWSQSQLTLSERWVGCVATGWTYNKYSHSYLQASQRRQLTCGQRSRPASKFKPRAFNEATVLTAEPQCRPYVTHPNDLSLCVTNHSS